MMSTNKGQPSALLLLPFSNNKVGTDSYRNTETNEYSTRTFPILAVTRVKKDARSKSATAHDVKTTQDSLRQRKRFLRASSERLSRGQTLGSESKLLKFRAKSEYSIDVIPRGKPDTASVYINDINEQTVCRNFVQRENYPTLKPYLLSPSRRSQNKSRALQKPASQLGQGPKPDFHTGDGHSQKPQSLRSHLPSQGGLELYRVNIAPDRPPSTEGSQKQPRLKLNVNELPRSKTPIAENDPDKLNINHVIAFLQTSDPDFENDEGDQEHQGTEIIVPGANILQSFPNNPCLVNESNYIVKNGQRNILITPDSVQLVNNASTNYALPHGKSHKVTPHRHPLVRPKSYGPGHVDKNDCQQNFVEGTGKVGEEGFKVLTPYSCDQHAGRSQSQSVMSASHHHHKTGNETLSWSREDNRPFRLHRFLTLVPGNSSCIPKQVSDEQDRITCTKTEESFNKIFHSSVKSHSSVHLNYLTSEDRASLKNESDTKFSPTRLDTIHFLSRFGVSKQPGSHLPNVANRSSTKERANIICLPTAHFELDSDDEGLPPVSIHRNKTMISTPDQDKAMLSTHDRNRTMLSTQDPHKTLQSSRDEVSVLETTSKSNNEVIGRSNTSLTITNNGGTHTSPLSLPSEKISQIVPTQQHSHLLNDLYNKASESNHPAGKDTSPFMTSTLPDQLIYNSSTLLESPVSISTQQVLNYVTPSMSHPRGHDTAFLNQLGTDSPKQISPDRTTRDQSTLLYRVQKSSNILREFPQEHIKLSLRKERDRTSGHTYMTDMEASLET